jgi:hypothetical protein
MELTCVTDIALALARPERCTEMSVFDIPVPGDKLLVRSLIGVAPLGDFGEHLAISPTWGETVYYVNDNGKYQLAGNRPVDGGDPRTILSALPEEVSRKLGKHPWPRLQFLQVLFDQEGNQPSAAVQVVIPRDHVTPLTVGRLYWGDEMFPLDAEVLHDLAPADIVSLDDGGRHLMQEKLLSSNTLPWLNETVR